MAEGLTSSALLFLRISVYVFLYIHVEMFHCYITWEDSRASRSVIARVCNKVTRTLLYFFFDIYFITLADYTRPAAEFFRRI